MAHDGINRRENAPVPEARQTTTATARTHPTSTPPPGHGIMAAPDGQLMNRAGDCGSDVDIESIATLSDYGSDIDVNDILLANALDTIAGAVPLDKSAVLPSLEFEHGELEDEEQDVDGFVQIHRPSVLRVTQSPSSALVGTQAGPQSSPVRERSTLEVEYDEISRRAWSGESKHRHSNPCRLTTNSHQFRSNNRPCRLLASSMASVVVVKHTLRVTVSRPSSDSAPSLRSPCR